MKRIAHVTLLLLILVPVTSAYGAARTRRAAATCTGSAPCRACKNCRYCKHCAKEGGRCGVCRRRKAEAVAVRSGGWEEAMQRLAPDAHPQH